jgi:hypothetical protein
VESTRFIIAAIAALILPGVAFDQVPQPLHQIGPIAWVVAPPASAPSASRWR